MPEKPDRLSVYRLKTIGGLLYGRVVHDRWQSYMARDLSRVMNRTVSPAVVNQWMTGRRPVPGWLRWAAMQLLLQAQADWAAASGEAFKEAMSLRDEMIDMRALAELGPAPEDGPGQDDGADLGDAPAAPRKETEAKRGSFPKQRLPA